MPVRSTIGRLVTSLADARSAAASLGSRLLAAALPPTCCVCGLPGIGPELDLCAVCRDELPRIAPERIGRAPRFDLVVIPFRYAWPVDHLVRALKFQAERAHARVLGTLIADARRGIDEPLPELLVPVPLHPARYRRRGFNQSRELARYAARVLGLRVDSSCLKRIVATREQSGLSLAERRRNVRKAFEVVRSPQACHIALVDDVVTTGSTASEAASALRKAGVRRIELWAAARAVLEKT